MLVSCENRSVHVVRNSMAVFPSLNTSRLPRTKSVLPPQNQRVVPSRPSSLLSHPQIGIVRLSSSPSVLFVCVHPMPSCVTCRSEYTQPCEVVCRCQFSTRIELLRPRKTKLARVARIEISSRCALLACSATTRRAWASDPHDVRNAPGACAMPDAHARPAS
jgi:hypothetical protein